MMGLQGTRAALCPRGHWRPPSFCAAAARASPSARATGHHRPGSTGEPALDPPGPAAGGGAACISEKGCGAPLHALHPLHAPHALHALRQPHALRQLPNTRISDRDGTLGAGGFAQSLAHSAKLSNTRTQHDTTQHIYQSLLWPPTHALCRPLLAVAVLLLFDALLPGGDRSG
jgi:hypothetical protein